MTDAFALQKASHIFSTKNIGLFQILKFEILIALTNNVTSFDQPDPGHQYGYG